MRVKHSVGAATLLIHMLAKHDTPMNARSTVFGRVPARLSTRVISRRSIADLLSADAMVKPPMSSMIVGENMTEKMYLPWRLAQHGGLAACVLGGCWRGQLLAGRCVPYHSHSH